MKTKINRAAFSDAVLSPDFEWVDREVKEAIPGGHARLYLVERAHGNVQFIVLDGGQGNAQGTKDSKKAVQGKS
jgi:hypothetical protein